MGTIPLLDAYDIYQDVFNVTAQSIADNARAALAVWKMESTRPDGPHQHIETTLQTLWGQSLKTASFFERYPGFNRSAFLDACTTSPQNWRYMAWVGGKWVNTSKVQS